MFRSLLIGLALALAVNAAYADAPASAGSAPPVEAFFSSYKVSAVQVSPDGRYLAAVFADASTGQGDKFLAVMDATDMKVETKFQVSEDQVIWRYWWANDQRVLIATATETGGFSVATFDGALFAVNVDGSQPLQLLGTLPQTAAPEHQPMPDVADHFSHIAHKGEVKSTHVDHFFSGMLYVPGGETHQVLVQGWSGDDRHPQAFDVDIYTGDVKVVVDSPVDNGGLLADAEGHVRLAWGAQDVDGNRTLFYRDVGDSASWRDLSALYKDVDPADEDTGPFEMAQDGKTFYWRGRSSDTTLALFSIDPADMSKKEIFSDPTFDVATIFLGDYPGNDHKVLAVETYPGLPQLHVIDSKDPETAELLALQQAFPGQEVDVVSATRDGRSMVLYVGSDRNPGDYYLFDTKTLRANYLFSRSAQIDPDKMASRQPVSLKSRDGLTLYGYLTVPPEAPHKDLPLILLPHGGPHNIRDYWHWDPEAEFFASHGYAVLQINFRGSGGYGLKFQSLGYRNWGTTMQDDLADAVQWAVKEGIADPNRICIYGASYGGYAALENPIRYPHLYKCAVGYVGVYDLTLEAKYGDVHRSAYGRNFLEIVNGNDTVQLKKYSPAFNADKITLPVFIAYGGKDQRVVPDNAKELMAAMDAAGKRYETLFDPYEVHGFGKPEDRFELYTRMLKFIGGNIGQAATKPAAAATAKSGSR